jgi:hypothetical protein
MSVSSAKFTLPMVDFLFIRFMNSTLIIKTNSRAGDGGLTLLEQKQIHALFV